MQSGALFSLLQALAAGLARNESKGKKWREETKQRILGAIVISEVSFQSITEFLRLFLVSFSCASARFYFLSLFFFFDFFFLSESESELSEEELSEDELPEDEDEDDPEEELDEELDDDELELRLRLLFFFLSSLLKREEENKN